MSRRFSGGSSDHFDLGTWSVNSDEMSIAAWVYAFSWNSGRDDRFVSKGSGTATTQHVFMLGKTDSTGAKLRCRFGNSNRTAIGTTTLPTATWFHAGAEYYPNIGFSDSIGGTRYNGVSQGAIDLFNRGLPVNTDTVMIGNHPTATTNAPDALLADVAIWSRKLTDLEWLALAQGKILPLDLPLGLVYYNPLRGDARDWIDRSLWRRNTRSISGTSLGPSPSRLIDRLDRRRTLKVPVAGGDVSVALSGQLVTTNVGSLGKTIDKALTGQSNTVSLGTLVAAIQKALSGQSNTISLGTITTARTVPVSGQSSSVSQGTITPTNSVELTGSSVLISQGTLAPTIQIPLVGASVTINLGTLTPVGGDSNNVSVTLTGLSSSISQGTLGVSNSLALVGEGLTSNQGTLTSALSVGISGVSATISDGILSITLAPELSGQVVTINQGALSPSTSVSLSGQTLTVSLGTITSSIPGSTTTTRIIWG